MLNLTDTPIILRGREVTLVPLEHEHVAALAAAAGESRERYNFTKVPHGVAATAAWVQEALDARSVGERYPFAIRRGERVVGSTSYSDYQPWLWPVGSALQRTDRPDAAEIGHTWLAASAQRTRCNTEAKFLLLRHAFETWQVHRIILRTDERNLASRRAIERLGARFEGIRRAERPGSDGTLRSSAAFSILAAEWPQVGKQLEALLSQDALR